MSHVECPTRDQLADYLLGVLEEPVADWVMGHLENCAECDGMIGQLEDISDSVIAGLREPPSSDECWCEPGYQKLISGLGKLHLAALYSGASVLSLRKPEQLDEYRVLEKIGEGGMGAVYRALHTKLDRVVALKVLSQKRLSRGDAVSRFEREMKAVGKLNHPNIVHAYDAGEAEDMPYLVMEFVQGIDLRHLVKEIGPLPIPEACEIVRQAAAGLDHAYRHGMVHRDIKPSNLMLTYVGSVKVLDLGIALLQDQPVEETDLTNEGQLIGTIEYMAPEQGDNSHVVDTRADIYSLGATLYKLLSGNTPFHGKKYETLLKKIKALVDEPVPPIRGLRADVSEGLACVLHRMLAKSPEDRYLRPRDVVEMLSTHATGADLPDLLRKHLLVQGEAQAVATAGPQGDLEATPGVAVVGANVAVRKRVTSTNLTNKNDVGQSCVGIITDGTRSVATAAPPQSRNPGAFGLVVLWTLLFFATAIGTMAVLVAPQMFDTVRHWLGAAAKVQTDDQEALFKNDWDTDLVDQTYDMPFTNDKSAGDSENDRQETQVDWQSSVVNPIKLVANGVTLLGREDPTQVQTQYVTERHWAGLENWLLEEINDVGSTDPHTVGRLGIRGAHNWIRWELWGPATFSPRLVWVQSVDQEMTELQLANTHDLLVATATNAEWYAWDLVSGQDARPETLLPAGMVTARIAPAGDVVVGIGGNATVSLLRRVQDGRLSRVAPLSDIQSGIDCLDVSSRGVLACGDRVGRLQLKQPNAVSKQQIYEDDDPIAAVQWNHQGDVLVASVAAPGQQSTQQFLLWNAPQEKARAVLSHEYLLTHVFDLSSNGRWVVTVASTGDKLVVWDSTGTKLRSISVPDGNVSDVCFLPQSPVVVVGDHQGQLKMIDVNTGRLLRPPVGGHGQTIVELRVAPNGHVLVSRDACGEIGIWDLSRNGPDLVVLGKAERLTAMTLSLDGTLLAVAGSNDQGSTGQIGLWLLSTGESLWNQQ